jgi:hypothetical protein
VGKEANVWTQQVAQKAERKGELDLEKKIVKSTEAIEEEIIIDIEDAALL